MARNSLDPQTIHELVVSSRDLMIIHCGNHSVAAELLNIGYTAAVDFHAIPFEHLTLISGRQMTIRASTIVTFLLAMTKSTQLFITECLH